jgi:hypothetical protein
MNLPPPHESFLHSALLRLQSDPRILGVAGAGSLITATMDEYSDLDLVVVSRNAESAEVARERHAIVSRLGTLLVAFTGEHVGEPRLLICLYDGPLLHVDVKFLSLDEFAERIENPVVLWERGAELHSVLKKTQPVHPMPDLQWIEDRFWIWVHYAALRLGRGELFELIDFLGFLRQVVLGPLSLVRHGQLPRGVRRLETCAPRHLEAMKKTVAGYDRDACISAIRATIALYQELRDEVVNPALIRRSAAEDAAVGYFEKIAHGA